MSKHTRPLGSSRRLCAWGTMVFAALVAAPISAYAQEPAPPSAPKADLSLQQRVDQLEQQIAQLQTLASDSAAAMNSEAEAAAETDRRVQIYGFMDAGFQRYFVPDESKRVLYPTTAGTFVSGNTNLYFDARPTPQWRGLAETRLTLLPHGDYIIKGLGPFSRADNTVLDSASPSGRNLETWGSIIVERASIQWIHNEKLEIHVGYFLTPWGIWNVDHGTPTLISLLLPTFIVQQAVPRRQTGVQLQGAIGQGDFELGYRAFLSNGRSSTVVDLTDDKAIGGRLQLRRFGTLNMLLGTSGYWGTSNDIEKRADLAATGSVVLSQRETYAFREWILGGDLSVDWRGLRVRAEGVVRHVRYDDGKHQVGFSLPGEYLPNRYELYSYLIVAYRMMSNFEPYTYLELMDTGMSTNFFPDKGAALSLGLNIYLTPTTQLKTQYSEFQYKNLVGDNKASYLTSRLVLVF